jgi:hypothetical protein
MTITTLPGETRKFDLLRTFHTGRDYRAAIDPENGPEIELAAQEMAAEGGDLLDLVPADHVADLRSPAQAELMDKLVRQITELDGEAGRKAAEYTAGMTERGLWTPGREGNASAWITRLINKERELARAARQAAPVTETPEIPDGRYAITEDEVKCYAVSNGKEGTRWEGFLFLDRISSDNRFPIRNRAEKARILAAIAADLDGAAVLAALTLRQCRHCGRELSDTKNPYFSMGLGPKCGSR